TEYADMRAAWDALPAATRAQIDGLRVHHSIAYSRQTLGFDFSKDEEEALKGAIHPLVRTIPRSGRRTLYVASHASRIIDLPVPLSRAMAASMSLESKPKCSMPWCGFASPGPSRSFVRAPEMLTANPSSLVQRTKRSPNTRVSSFTILKPNAVTYHSAVLRGSGAFRWMWLIR